MKKLFFTLSLASVLTTVKSQVVLNEIYSEPNGGKSEFIELYNNSVSGTQNLDCFTILTYWESGANSGWYVMDLPAFNLAAKGFYVLSASNPFSVQSQSGVVPNLNWNALPFRSGADSYLKSFQRNGATYTDLGLANGAAVNDLSSDVSPTGASGHNYFTFVFQNGAIVNGFWGGGPSGTLPSGITSMPNLTITPAGACGIPFTINFSTLGAVESVNQAPGSDNGYARTSDGKCGAWDKTSASVNHTPGITNGSASGLVGALTTSQLIQCNTTPTSSSVIYNITAVSGSASEADDFPVEVQLYYDYGTIGQLDGADTYQSSQFDALVADGAKTFSITTTQPVILVYKTKRGCFDKVVPLFNTCISLPVDFKTFTAARNRSNVLLKWETSSEQNNRGFAVERNIGNNSWQEVAFVPTQAAGGNSASLLSYQYVDFNEAKSMTQYRIRQVDNDNRSKYTQVRSIRGLDQGGGIIVYPNPTVDGKVNVVFEETTSIKNISVMDMSGKTLKQINGISSNSIVIDNLNPGMYTLRVFVPATGEQSVQKIVVNKR